MSSMAAKKNTTTNRATHGLHAPKLEGSGDRSFAIAVAATEAAAAVRSELTAARTKSPRMTTQAIRIIRHVVGLVAADDEASREALEDLSRTAFGTAPKTDALLAVFRFLDGTVGRRPLSPDRLREKAF